MSPSTSSLLSGRALAGNILWTLAGMGTPLLVALISIPHLISELGKERFGLLAIVWMGIGYFSLFDMGLGKALTKLIAEHLGRDEKDSLPGLIWTALWLMFFVGFFAAGIVFAAAPILITHVLIIPGDLQTEGILAFRILSIGLPVVILTAALVGILEAHQRFAHIAVVRSILGIFTFLAPLITSAVSMTKCKK